MAVNNAVFTRHLFSAVSKDPESADRAGNAWRCANDIPVSGLKKPDEIDLRLKHPVYTVFIMTSRRTIIYG